MEYTLKLPLAARFMASDIPFYWLGLDVGTSSSRALLVDSAGQVQHAFSAPHEDMHMAKPLWAEQDPDNWWLASKAAIRGVLRAGGIDGKSVAGVGLSGQMHGLVLLDADHKVIRPALIWCDQRSQRQVDFINSKSGRRYGSRATRPIPVLTGFTLPKLLWIRDHEPKHFEAVRNFLLPKDYIRFKLTGEFATDVSDASGTAMFDVVNRRWSEEMMTGLGLDRSILPKMYESSAVSGEVTEQAARETGLSAGTVVVAGAGDQAASAIGNGIVTADKDVLHRRHLRRGIRVS